jgi:methionyl-tRNA formyltransferase
MAEQEPRVVVFAYSEVGTRCLETLLRLGAHVVGVFTYEDDPQETIWFRSVAQTARKAGLPVLFGPPSEERVRALRPDLLFSFYYRDMIGESVLRLPRLGAFNMHGSLLPKYRGRACVNWAVLMGETETGATLHHMVKSADAGDIVDQERVPILFEDTAQDVAIKVADAAVVVLERSWPLLVAGRTPRIPQDPALATTFGRRRPEDGRIDWTWEAKRIYNLVRAVTHPFPGAFTFAGGRKLLVWRCFPEEKLPAISEPLSCGTVLSTAPLRVLAGNGTAVRLEQVQWANSTDEKPPLSKEDVMDGMTFGEQYLRQGDLLGLREDQVDLRSRKDPLFRAHGEHEHGHTGDGDMDTNRRNGRSHDA